MEGLEKSDKKGMKACLICAFLLCVSLNLFAKESDERIIVTPLSNEYPVDCCFSKDHYNVALVKERQTISPQVRDSWFAEAGLSKEVASWDHLERDLLYKRAVGLPEANYFKKYPKINPAKLKKLRSLLIKKGIKP